jgi:hypothetical protein
MRMLRYIVGRWLIHLGLRVLPRGRVRDEIHNLLGAWAYRVRSALQQGGSE